MIDSGRTVVRTASADQNRVCWWDSTGNRTRLRDWIPRSPHWDLSSVGDRTADPPAAYLSDWPGSELRV